MWIVIVESVSAYGPFDTYGEAASFLYKYNLNGMVESLCSPDSLEED